MLQEPSFGQEPNQSTDWQPKPASSRNGRTPQSALIVFVLMALAFTGGWFSNQVINNPVPQSAKPYSSTIWDAWSLIDKYYVNKNAINHQQMAYDMISAMVNSLGDTGHTRFLTPQEVQQFNAQITNSDIVGIGVFLEQEQSASGVINVIQATIPKAPANTAGLLPGDQFISVNGQDVTHATQSQLSSVVRGKQGTPVTITVYRSSTKQNLTFTITRQSFSAPLVTFDYFQQNKIGFVQLSGFDLGASQQLASALKTLQTEGMQSLILDLRGNPGGYVSEAIAVASDFLANNQVIVYEKSSDGSITPDMVQSDGMHLTMPMAILVDNGTASAAEIVTAAIHDNRPNVPVIGVQTFGTDTVLEQFDLPDGSQLLLGIKEYLTPDKTHFQPGVGLIPTQVVTLPANSFPENPLTLQELNQSENSVLAGQGLTNDTQLIAAIKFLQTANANG